MILNERVIRIVLTLAEELHFGRAASILHVSQPALSGTVTSLEHSLGVRLFRRTSRYVELTSGGRIFVAEARRLAQESEKAVALIRRSASEAVGPLRVGYSITVDSQWLWSLVSRARTNGLSDSQLVFVSAEAVDLQQGLIKGALHAGLSAGDICESSLQSVPLRRQDLILALHRSHALSRQLSVRLVDLQREPVVWLARDLNPRAHGDLMVLCDCHAYRPEIVQEVRTFYECLQFVNEGLGITFVPEYMEEQCPNQQVIFKRLAGRPLYIQHTFAYRSVENPSALERFVTLIRDSEFHRRPSRGQAKDSS